MELLLVMPHHDLHREIRCEGVLCRAPRGFLGTDVRREDTVPTRASIEGTVRLAGAHFRAPWAYLPRETDPREDHWVLAWEPRLAA